MVPPARRLLKEADCRAGYAILRIDVAPGPDDAATGYLKVFQKPWDRIGIAVRPRADGKDGALDGAPVLADRTVFPVGIVTLMF